MKYIGITFGRIIESFCILPSIDLTWATFKVKDKLPGNYAKYYDLQFTWLFWYFIIGQIKKKLNEQALNDYE